VDDIQHLTIGKVSESAGKHPCRGLITISA